VPSVRCPLRRAPWCRIARRGRRPPPGSTLCRPSTRHGQARKWTSSGFREWELVRHDGAFLAYLQQRGPHPGYQLLQPETVAAWVKDRHDRTAREGDGDEHVRRLIVNGQADLTINLRYIDDRQERIVTVDSRGPLGKLAKLAEKLADRYRWTPALGADFVLTGRVPEVFVYTGSAQIRYGIDSSAATRVTMTLDPFLTLSKLRGSTPGCGGGCATINRLDPCQLSTADLPNRSARTCGFMSKNLKMCGRPDVRARRARAGWPSTSILFPDTRGRPCWLTGTRSTLTMSRAADPGDTTICQTSRATRRTL
jgi:hypothetical protein